MICETFDDEYGELGLYNELSLNLFASESKFKLPNTSSVEI